MRPEEAKGRVICLPFFFFVNIGPFLQLVGRHHANLWLRFKRRRAAGHRLGAGSGRFRSGGARELGLDAHDDALSRV